MAHGEAREEKWRGKRRMEWVVSTYALYRNPVYPALLPLMRTPWLPAAGWTDTPADINGLVRFAGRPNLVSARVPSHSVFTLQLNVSALDDGHLQVVHEILSKQLYETYCGLYTVVQWGGHEISTQRMPLYHTLHSTTNTPAPRTVSIPP